MVTMKPLQVLSQDFDFDFVRSSILHVATHNLVLILFVNMILNNLF